MRSGMEFMRPLRCGVLIALTLGFTSTALAVYPPPANDTPASAEAIPPLPALVIGSNVRGDDTVTATPLSGLTSVPGPDVFYTFTPAASGSYWMALVPWIQVPVYASSGAGLPVPNLCLYVREAGTSNYIGGANATITGQPETVVVSLSAGVTYEIVVDSTETEPRGQEFEFTLFVDAAPTGDPDDCSTPGMLTEPLPAIGIGSLTGATDDFQFTDSDGRCSVGNTSGLTLPAPDNVWELTTGPTPDAAGDYVITLVPLGVLWNGYVYVADSCPPFFPLGCLGAASHTSSTSRQSETVVVTLDYDTTYYIYVDAATFSLPDAKYMLVVDRADAWDFTEVEDNDTPATASPLGAGVDGGQIVGPGDIDYWSFSAPAGAKLYAFVDNGNAMLSGIDTTLTALAPNAATVLEFDNDDGEGAASPLASWAYRSSAFSAALAGTPLSEGGTYYLAVESTPTDTIARYRLHAAYEPPGRLPALECEGNDTPGLADRSGKDYFIGAIATQGDIDNYAFEASAGERIMIALDGDPERNSGGLDSNSPYALDGALRLLDPDGDELISDLDDPSTVTAGEEPDYPAEIMVFVAPVSGTYTVQVSGGDPAIDFGAERTYELAIFKAEAAPVLSEATDPVIDSITPNFGTDTVAVVASDDAVGDSGVCDVVLAAGSVNLVLQNVSFTAGDPTVSFDIGLVNSSLSGAGKLIVTDCAGNTACATIEIDATLPQCGGAVVVSGERTFHASGLPVWAPDYDANGVMIELPVTGGSKVLDAAMTLSLWTARISDAEVFLISPLGTTLEVLNDQGSSSAFSMYDAHFTDAAAETIGFLSEEPFTGDWLPKDPNGFAKFATDVAAGTWTLWVRDDSSSPSGGLLVADWSLTLDAEFPNPEHFEGQATDAGGLASVALQGASNLMLTVDPAFVAGDTTVTYRVELVDPAGVGSGTVVVTDLSSNTCTTPIALTGVTDTDGPASSGAVTRDFTIGATPLAYVPNAMEDPNGVGVTSMATVAESAVVAEVEVGLTINSLDIGRLASTLTKGSAFTALLNRVGMDDRDSVGLTKDNISLAEFDDDAPVTTDAHEEPALGTLPFTGPHQPDGRGAYIGNGITTDYRDNMLFALEGADAAGTWALYVSDNRYQSATAAHHEFRTWHALLRTPGAPERYVGQAADLFPGAGICTIALAGGATNLAVQATFTPGDHEVDYVVALVDPTQPGSGTLEITDCANNVTPVAISLAPATADQTLPVISGAVDLGLQRYVGTATDAEPTDSGIVAVELAPYAENLQLVSLTPDPPNGAAAVDFEIGLVDPNMNGRGYVRVTDATGFRRHALVWIDATKPVCTGEVSRSKRYVSQDTPVAIPDNNAGGVLSTIAVADADRISDLNLTLNITHGYDDDIDLYFSNPLSFALFSDIGSTGNDFTDTTLDDEAAEVIPDSSSAAPFTGSFKPEPPAVLSVFDGAPAAGAYTLRVVDDAVYNIGTLDNWALTITSTTFPPRYDGRVEDSTRNDQGVCTIALLAGATNLTLTVDAFDPGAKIVRYSVELTNPDFDGAGTVVITDCAGNQCDTEICLIALPPDARYGDLYSDGVIDGADWLVLEGCYSGLTPVDLSGCNPCIRGDYDGDSDIDLRDLAAFQDDVGDPGD